ncbi:MAG: hypothetical protein WA957_13245 [Alteraurantiacibacter sp.]
MATHRIAPFLALVLASCGQGEPGNVPGNFDDGHAFSGIADGAVINLTGTEPFWNARIEGGTMLYRTPGIMDGVRVPVSRFAGRGGLAFSGTLDGSALDLAITPAQCSDGMSNRSYPFVATLQIGTVQQEGCAWREGDDIGEP